MPSRNYSGGGSISRQNGTMTRNIAPGNDRREEQPSLKREINPAKVSLERPLISYLAEDNNFPSFRAQLARVGLQLRDIPADGNCLFRALGDQLEGHCRNHYKHRQEVVSYMKSHRHDFEPFVEDDRPFDDHVKTLQKLGTHAGNDALVAFAKLHNVNIIIHQLSGRPLLIPGPTAGSGENIPQLHIAYHNGDHYSSVRKLGDSTESPANISMQNLVTEKNHRLQNGHSAASGAVVTAKRGLEDIEEEVSVATNCRDFDKVRQVLVEFDYDVDASITTLLQQMELRNGNVKGGSTLPASPIPNMAEHALSSSSATTSSCSSSPNCNSSRITGSVLKANGHSCTNGKGHKVHFREDSYSRSSGYGSLSSHIGHGARPKMIPMQHVGYTVSHKRFKDPKKMEKKRQAEDTRRERLLGVHHYIPRVTDVRNVAVVSMQNGKLTRL